MNNKLGIVESKKGTRRLVSIEGVEDDRVTIQYIDGNQEEVHMSDVYFLEDDEDVLEILNSVIVMTNLTDPNLLKEAVK